ncbi:MAG TPA: hypothetical protein VI111_08445 [Thermoleophilaceae bacterium]
MKLRFAALALLACVLPATARADELPLAQSHLREAVIALPAGVSLSPGAADGLVACPDQSIGFGTDQLPACPEASKVGTVAITSPPIAGGLTGSIYVRASTPDQLFRIVLTANSDKGVHIKLPGEIRLDPQSGQVTAVFAELPQLPFSSLEVRFKGGPRAVLANPIDCGSYSTRSVLTPWSGSAPVTTESLFEVGDSSCSGTLPFDPAVQAGTIDPVARAFTAFVFRVQRQDGRQELERLALTLPPGVTAKLASVRPCAADAAASGVCSADARIGTLTVGAGAGSAPFYLTGDVFLSEAYGGGRFGLAIVVRVLAGPFDLGTVIIRAAVSIDPTTAQLKIVSEPLPHILRGVPLRLRDVHLAIDRPDFMLNPTSCRRTQVKVAVSALQGASSETNVPFQIADCAALRFSPHFSVGLVGRGQTTDGKRPGLRVEVRARPGQANLRSVAFTLPPQIAFDASRGGPRMCTRDQLAARACPRSSRVGKAQAVTSLLRRPLTGPVYFIRGVRGDVFPKLAMLLDGELQIDLLGSTAVTHGGLRTTFGTLPDVPLSAFTLRLGPGLLTPTRDLCARTPISLLTMRAHSGRRVDRRVRLRVPCPRTRRR